MVRFLDHPSQPRRKKKSNRSQYADQNEHPKEYPVNDHGHILPVLLYLRERGDTTEGRFKIPVTSHQFFLPAVTVHLRLISPQWRIFPPLKSNVFKCHSIFSFYFFLSFIKKKKFKVKLEVLFFFFF